MKITLSKKQWSDIGKKAGWMKKAQITGEETTTDINYITSSDQIVFSDEEKCLKNYIKWNGRDEFTAEYLKKGTTKTGTFAELVYQIEGEVNPSGEDLDVEVSSIKLYLGDENAENIKELPLTDFDKKNINSAIIPDTIKEWKRRMEEWD